MNKTYKIEQQNGKYIIIYYIDNSEYSRELYAHSDGKPLINILEGFYLIIEDPDINVYKKNLVNLIDEKSVEKINQGFQFDGKTFSLSLSAQINWSNLLFLPESFFPVNLSTKDDDIYSLTYNNVQLFYQAALNGKNTPLQEGNNLKQQVKAATVKEELDLIKNNL